MIKSNADIVKCFIYNNFRIIIIFEFDNPYCIT